MGTEVEDGATGVQGAEEVEEGAGTGVEEDWATEGTEVTPCVDGEADDQEDRGVLEADGNPTVSPHPL